LEHCDRLDPGRVHTVGFRPEKLRVSRSLTHHSNNVAGVVERITYAGTLSYATICIAGGRRLDATLMNAHDDSADGLAAGDAVFVGLPSDAGVTLTE
jgi:hypothetical protein